MDKRRDEQKSSNRDCLWDFHKPSAQAFESKEEGIFSSSPPRNVIIVPSMFLESESDAGGRHVQENRFQFRVGGDGLAVIATNVIFFSMGGSFLISNFD